MSHDDERDAARGAMLRSFGADPETMAELLAYGASHFDVSHARALRFPMADEPFVAAWRHYARDAATEGVVPVLRRRLVQLRFPIVDGISATEPYRRATSAGCVVTETEGATGLTFRAPHAIRLVLHPSAAGTIPTLIAEERDDFVALVRALTQRNEPVAVPASQGACMVAGYMNWDRMAGARHDWERQQRERFRDRFIILSAGDYSGVPSAALGLANDAWRRLSLTIRLEHEAAHYFTRRAFGSMRNSLLDELIADYAGITAALGEYRAAWFLRFLGLDESHSVGANGRMHNYRGSPPLSDVAFALLGALVRRAAAQVESFDAVAGHPGASAAGRAAVIAALVHFTLEELARDDGADRLHRQFACTTRSDVIAARRARSSV